MRKEPGGENRALLHHTLWSLAWLALTTLAAGFGRFLTIIGEVARVVLLRAALLLSTLTGLLSLLSRVALLAALLTALSSVLVLLCHCTLHFNVTRNGNGAKQGTFRKNTVNRSSI